MSVFPKDIFDGEVQFESPRNFSVGRTRIDFYDSHDLNRTGRDRDLYWFTEATTGIREHEQLAKEIMRNINNWGFSLYKHYREDTSATILTHKGTMFRTRCDLYYVVKRGQPPSQALS